MNKQRFSAQVLLIFSLITFLVISGCSSSSDSTPASATTYTISGAVSGTAAANVTITLSGDSITTVSKSTASDGTYSFTGLANGSYTVVPSLTGYKFNPVSAQVTVSGGDATVTTFVETVATGSTYTISGKVSGAVKNGVTMTLSGTATGTTATASGGTYSFPGVPGGTYTVTPTLSGYSFQSDSSDVSSSFGVTVGSANVDDANFISTAVYSQADVATTWNVTILTAGSNSKWERGTLTFDSNGALSATSNCLDSSGSTSSCPATGSASMAWNIDSNGVITGSGANVDGDTHMTMAADKAFIAGTSSGGGGTKFKLYIAQKLGTSYDASDIQSKLFVFHQVTVGSNTDDAEWRHGVGSTDSSGAVTISSETSPSGGTVTTGLTSPGTMSLDTNTGIVTIASTSFQGFLSADKKTIVAVETNTSGSNPTYHMMVIQITGRTYSGNNIPDAVFGVHMLADGVSPAPFWAHWTNTSSGGTMAFSGYTSTAGGLGPTTMTVSMSSAGVVTGDLDGNTTYNGQVSDDGTFVVGTLTNTTNIYSLLVHTLR